MSREPSCRWTAGSPRRCNEEFDGANAAFGPGTSLDPPLAVLAAVADRARSWQVCWDGLDAGTAAGYRDRALV